MEAAIAEMNATMNAKLDMLCGTINKINDIETSVRHLVTENATLKADLASRDVKIQQLTDHVNRLDQASRSTSLRILGLPVTTQSTTTEIIKAVYNEILLPILTSAKAEGDIDNIRQPTSSSSTHLPSLPRKTQPSQPSFSSCSLKSSGLWSSGSRSRRCLPALTSPPTE
jgi:hypothetical protein